MTPVDQAITDEGRGDCLRAALATLLDLELEAVPHFCLLPINIWHNVFTGYLWSLGFEFDGTGNPETVDIQNEQGFGGYFLATVPSKNFNGITHAVVMDREGVVVHDPHPDKDYQDENIIESNALLHFSLVKRRTDDIWKSWERARGLA